jgi:ankyrin repeat protein
MKRRRLHLWIVGIAIGLVVIPFVLAAPQWILAGDAANGDLKGVSFLLRAGVDPNTPDCDAGSAIVTASQQGQTAVVEKLIAAGANVNVYPEGYECALSAAASEGHIDTMNALLAGGADPNVDRGREVTPLRLAEGHPDEIKLLKAAGEKD